MKTKHRRSPWMGTLLVPTLLFCGCSGDGSHTASPPGPQPDTPGGSRPGTRVETNVNPLPQTPTPVGAHHQQSVQTPDDDPLVHLWATDLDSREIALEHLLARQDPDLPSVAALLLTDPDAELRQALVDQLTDLGGPLAVSLLSEAIYDPHPAVRQAALEGLEELDAL